MTNTEPPDHHNYHWIHFEKNNVEFFERALTFYIDLLEKEALALEADQHLRALLADDFARSDFARSVAKARRFREWLQSKLAGADDYSCDLTLQHGDVRYLKSVGLLYLQQLTLHRNALSRRPNISSSLLADVDRKISSMESTLQSAGVFANASAVPLLVELALESSLSELPEANSGRNPDSLAQAHRPMPVVVSSIELLDSELRGRCLDMFEKFRAAGEHHRYDTVITDATRILEDRMRRMSGAPATATGMDLTSLLLGGNSPRVTLGETPGEQAAVAALFRGTFGFIRNPVHHRLRADFTPARTVQLLGLVDYLLGLLEGADVREAAQES